MALTKVSSSMVNEQPAFSVYSNANQTVSSGVATKVALNAEDVDTNSNFDSTTNYRFTPTVAGYYQLNLSTVGYSSSTQISSVAVMLYKNGSQYTYSQTNTSATALAAAFLSLIVYANGTTDYFEMYGAIGGTNVIISGGSSRTTTFSGSLVRAA